MKKITTTQQNTRILAAIILSIMEGKEHNEKINRMLREMADKGFIDVTKYENMVRLEHEEGRDSE